MNVKHHLIVTELAEYARLLANSKPCAPVGGTSIIGLNRTNVRRPPFTTQQQEAEAIDAKVFALKLKSKHLAYYQRTTRLSNLIADGMKAAAQLRVANG